MTREEESRIEALLHEIMQAHHRAIEARLVTIERGVQGNSERLQALELSAARLEGRRAVFSAPLVSSLALVGMVGLLGFLLEVYRSLP